MPGRAKTENITIVLNRPKYPGNVGFVARFASNMGIDKVIVVGNRNLAMKEMKQTTTHFAARIVDRIKHLIHLTMRSRGSSTRSLGAANESED